MNREKEQIAIERLRAFEPKDGEKYWLAYSGGKDSDAIRILAQIAGVKHEIHHNLTTVDAPETMQYIKSIPDVIIDKSRWEDGSPITMWNLIPKKLMPPTRVVRYCCAKLKEHGGYGRLKITGVRWAESVNRRQNADTIRVIGKEKTTQRMLDDMGLQFRLTKQGGIIMNVSTGDNDALRDEVDFTHQCYRDRSVSINPIVDWSDDDVWEFLHYYGCDSNPLYQCGASRIGCIGCPLAGHEQQRDDFRRYPAYKKNYIRAFYNMLEERKRKGLASTEWNTGEDVMNWWIQDNPDIMSFFDEDEIYQVMSEIKG